MTAQGRNVPMDMSPHRSGAGGMTLFELLVCVAIFTVILNVIMSIFDSGTRLSALIVERLDRMDGALTLQQGFAKAVREAVGVADRIGDYRTGEDTLVLQLPSASGVRRYAILGRLSQGDCLCRMDVVVRHTGMEAASFVRYPIALASYRFGFDQGVAVQARLVSLDFEIRRAADEGGSPLRHTFAAALRGFGPAGAQEAP